MTRTLGDLTLQRDARKMRVMIGSASVPSSTTDHGVLLGLDHDDHVQYVHLDSARTIPAQHLFSPAVPQAPFLLGANAQGQLVTGLYADQLSKQVVAGAGLTGGGVLTADRTLNVGAGSGILVTADAVAADLATATPLDVSLTAGNVGTATKEARENHRHLLNQSITPTWLGLHIFNAGLQVAADQNLKLGADAALTRHAADNLGPVAGDAIRSASYTQGFVGWRISAAGDAEFNNVDIRGALRTSVFEYATILATGGSQIIVQAAGKLYADCTSVDSPTTFDVDIEDPAGMTHAAAGALWAVDEIIRLKEPLAGSTRDLWATISSKTDMTTYWRLTVVKQSPVSNYTFRAGLAVLNYGLSGAGGIYLSADQTNSPWVRVFTHAGSPWSAMAEHVRLGNLKGNWGYAATTFGLAVGEYAATKANITIDPTNGLRLRNYDATVLQLDNSGGAYIQGVLNVGTSGGIFQGTGTFAAPTTALKIYNSGGIGLLEMWGSGVKQVYMGTDGYLYAGAGGVWLNSSGINLDFPADWLQAKSISWLMSGSVAAQITTRRYTYISDTQDLLRFALPLSTTRGNVFQFRSGAADTVVIIGKAPIGFQADTLVNGIKVLIGGIESGDAPGEYPADGEVMYTSNLRPYRSAVDSVLTAYAFVPLATPWTHTSWDGDAKSDVLTATLLDMSTFTGAPADTSHIKAYLLRLVTRDSAPWGTANLHLSLGPSQSPFYQMVSCRPTGGDIWAETTPTVPCDANGDLWYQIDASGTLTLDAYIIVWGYFT